MEVDGGSARHRTDLATRSSDDVQQGRALDPHEKCNGLSRNICYWMLVPSGEEQDLGHTSLARLSLRGTNSALTSSTEVVLLCYFCVAYLHVQSHARIEES